MTPNTLIKCLAVAGVAAALWSSHSLAQPVGLPKLTEVADEGGEPARPYYVAIGAAGVPESEGYHANISGQASQADGATITRNGGSRSDGATITSESAWLPVTSQHLSPGTVEARRLNLAELMTPFFMVGDDPLSRRWLKQRGDALREMNAVGLVVNVQNMGALEQLRQIGHGLELRPVSGDDIARRIGLEHYPVLFSRRGLEQ